MSTALDGGAPLDNTLAAFFFGMLHDKLPHDCLIAKYKEGLAQATDKARARAGSPEGMTLAGIFGGMAEMELYGQEWSYITEEEAFPCMLLAGAAIDKTQRWVCAGVEEPRAIPLGPLVARPEWALAHYASQEEADFRAKAREYVERMEREVAEATTSAR